ncbi:MAG: sigma-70 family RNA polymerase sigma factor [Limnospira sp.]
MRPRHSIIEIFSTFVNFADDRFSNWVSDPGLHRSMESSLKQTPESSHSEDFWALHWHNRWKQESKPSPRVEGHLLAYLQETCYWVARKTAQAGFVGAQVGLADLFQMAIAQVRRIFKGFNAGQGASLKDYAGVTFKSIIRDTLRQRRETDICSDWALLRKISQKRLEEALSRAGLSPAKIAEYRLAWSGFKTLYVPERGAGTRQLPPPNPATWEAIAAQYNRDRHTLPAAGTEVSPEILERWLKESAKWTRAYLYPDTTSLNAAQPGQDREYLDYLRDDERESPLDQAILQEEMAAREARRSQVHLALAEAIAKLKPELQEILKLYYGRELTQQEIARQLQTKQYTVSRRLSKARELLVKALARWSQDTQNISPTCEQIQQMAVALEEWLPSYFEQIGDAQIPT